MTAGDEPQPADGSLPGEHELADIEAMAVMLARLGGEEITRALARGVQVSYKGDAKGEAAPTDPVSEVDHQVEALIRERVGQEFGAHGIIGEEVDAHPDADADYLWVVDPLDGTTNFVNGFPLFASAVGVLYRGVPVVGATWCSASGTLGPGVYHARSGGELYLDGEAVASSDRNPGLKRRLAAAPGGSPGRTSQWDHRVTGSAAIECAYVAAGIFTSARFGGLRIWDLAGGIVLVRAAGREAWMRSNSRWAPLTRFAAPERVNEDREPSLRDWSQPVMVGTGDAIQAMIPERRSFWQRARGLLLPG